MSPYSYFDDPAVGVSPSTSHPRFVELAPAFFYNVADDFSPFGSDSGADTYNFLQQWYQAEQGDAAAFLPVQLSGWALQITPAILETSDENLHDFLEAKPTNWMWLVDSATAVVTTALGQLKIEGIIDPGLLQHARVALAVIRRLYSDTAHAPDWAHQARGLASLDAIEAVLQRVADEDQ